ncbi:SDR family oxidoreductase [Paraconexibacter algicola]|uniref:Short chain dehydrogenase n=1 Tax=Paraconexibacter algicola TaxID=2133960 RepID=A0A2T4UH25_9ACTN|nr:SDR family oxidoreductase [Paraconexibacter algicola]PTL58543.1 short chain dehydrogenase [Paraconexibacter algicola]
MAKKSVSGKQCLITGAASGIGRATAIATARRGGILFLTDVQGDRLDEVVAEIRAAGGTVAFAQAADIADHDAVVAMAAAIHAEHGAMDVVMNVAGISIWGSVETLTHEQWRRVIDIDLMGPIHVIETFVPPMIAADRGGHLVNVSSAAGLLGLPWHAAYSAAKFGLRGVSEVLRFDLRRHGIGVSLVVPGGVDTPLVQTVEIAGIDRENPAIQKMVGRFRRHARTPEQVAESILVGIEKDRYLVHTSPDIRLGYLAQRVFPPGYALAMRLLNDQFVRITRQARQG